MEHRGRGSLSRDKEIFTTAQTLRGIERGREIGRESEREASGFTSTGRLQSQVWRIREGKKKVERNNLEFKLYNGKNIGVLNNVYLESKQYIWG